MIVVIATFQLPQPLTLDAARKIFQSTAPKYQGLAGLVRKHYVLSSDGRTAGGVYLWNSRADADALYTDSWRGYVKSKYGAEPSVVYFDNPVVVDNLSQQILSDA